MSTVTHYSFGSFELYPSEQLLVRDHQPIPLSPKSFDLLLTLVSNHGRLMTRETLMKTIWPDSFVEETNLTVNISLLRKTLGEMDDGRPWIATAPKRGYRFDGPVSLHDQELPVAAAAKPENAVPGTVAAVQDLPQDPPETLVVKSKPEAPALPPTPAHHPGFSRWVVGRGWR
jgi:DNA-binding winged helix-turn-helix (wHTH) protein